MEGPPSKDDLRRAFRERRRKLTPLQRESHDNAVNRSVIEMVGQIGARSISAYLAFDGEPDLRPAMNHLSSIGLQIALPVITHTTAGKSLQFHAWHPQAELSRNAFGIEEPDSKDLVHLHDLDLVLIPLVAWDRFGNRLGMGAGYYDRALAALTGLDRPMRIGVGYSLQRAEKLPEEPWDVRLHGVITENGWFTCPA